MNDTNIDINKDETWFWNQNVNKLQFKLKYN